MIRPKSKLSYSSPNLYRSSVPTMKGIHCQNIKFRLILTVRNKHQKLEKWKLEKFSVSQWSNLWYQSIRSRPWFKRPILRDFGHQKWNICLNVKTYFYWVCSTRSHPPHLPEWQWTFLFHWRFLARAILPIGIEFLIVDHFPPGQKS